MKLSHIIITVLVLAMWGINFSILKMALAELDPFILTACRFLLAAIPAVFFIARPQVPMKIIALYGIVFGVGLWGVMALAVHAGVSAGMASLLLQSSAFISVIIGALWLKERISVTKLVGLLVAATGLGLVMTVQDGSVSFTGVLLVLFAACAMSASLLIVKRANIKDMFAFIVWSCLFAPLPLLALTAVTSGVEGFYLSIENLSSVGIFSILVQAYPVTLLGYYIWNKFVSIYPMSTMAPLTLLIPVFGFLGSWYFYQEGFTQTKVIACMLILLGIMINMFEPAMTKISLHLKRKQYG